MFSKSKTPRAEAGRKTEPSPPSIISRGLEITGDMTTDGEVHVDGRVVGDIKCGKLIVGTGASVEGEVRASHVDIRGQVSGRIHGEVVTLARTARVVGDIWHTSLAMEAGAHLEGQVRKSDGKGMMDEPLKAILRSKPDQEPVPTVKPVSIDGDRVASAS
ncbi:MAG: polymer-forming cytoskeletal protein [Minwuia sp.]|nr:polymer-forming cytoskeletal protein [Minwuia sp.]